MAVSQRPTKVCRGRRNGSFLSTLGAGAGLGALEAGSLGGQFYSHRKAHDSRGRPTLRRHGLDSESVKAKLLFAGLFLPAYEVLRVVVVARTHRFFAHEWTTDGPTRSAAYKRRILDHRPNAFLGSGLLAA